MQIQRVIEELGFTSREAKVYLAALSLGESHISDIAAKVRLPRTSAQVIVEKLHREGLLNFYVRRRYTYWVAEQPERLMVTLKEREASLKTILPRLNALKRNSGDLPSVSVLKGADEIKFIHDDIIATKRPIQAIISWDEWIDLLGYDYMKEFRERRSRRFLRMEMLVPKTDSAVKIKAKDQKELRHTKFLPSDVRISTSSFIYHTKVAVVSLNRKQPTAVIIDDSDIADTMRVFFATLWKQGLE